MALAQNITVIPARRTVGTQKPAAKVQKARVAAYCRVSTEFEEQESSYDVQIEHYTSYIKGNPEWELVEVYDKVTPPVRCYMKLCDCRRAAPPVRRVCIGLFHARKMFRHIKAQSVKSSKLVVKSI